MSINVAGDGEEYPDVAWQPNVLVNEDRLCHKVNTPTTKAEQVEAERLATIDEKTKESMHTLAQMRYSRQQHHGGMTLKNRITL